MSLTIEDFKKRYPQHRNKSIRIVKGDAEGEQVQVAGKNVPAIGQDVVIVETKPVSRIAWIFFGAIAFAGGLYVFKRFGPQAPPQQLVLAPAPTAESGLSAQDEALAEILAE